ncbi:hypothetical protein [Desulfurococcus mucosus]|uniref:Uncharacterized protein n=1 Tax=Desulfurococcus mucosus (strain ATCC 35584 / DSM 2162 / JCM 9187 / O7/1) TaxID=765177 RepID=E8RAH9_DESM0|nr:hypothetical protein [Desulfurococcus mucosus]ADV64389.1 hypothetical protein Desmu_0070 [Desulfurococcus mucosus DSM 2162]
MKPLEKPPRIKVLEAAGSIGDNRVRVVDSTHAVVTSSTGERSYRVVLIQEEAGVFRVYSDDNGTIHRGYIGYPIIAFMILKGLLPVDNTVVKAFTGIPWKELNEKYKKYSVVENIVISRAERMGVPRNVVDDYINVVLKKLGIYKVFFDESLANA